MKYAICFRGISYLENHIHKPGVQPFDIDFSFAIPYYIKYFIEPLRLRGDTVDIYFNTYTSKKLDYFKEQLNPTDILLGEYTNRPWGDWRHIWKLAIDSLDQVNNKDYDWVILARFDLLPFVDVTTVYFPPDAISIVTPFCDMIQFIPGNLITSYLEMADEWRYKDSTHSAPAKLLGRGVKVHTMYGCIPNNTHKFFGATANFFLPTTHEYYKCPVDELWNPESEHYGFYYPPMIEYTCCG